jgi:cobalt-zinc-cadmium efflux system outer membrane protein
VVLPSNPRLFGDYRRLAPGPQVAPLDGFQVGVDALFEVSGAGAARVEEAGRRLALARADLASERVRARARAWGTWVEVQVATQRVAVLEEAEAVQRRVELASRERQLAGVAGEPDLAAATLELASVRAQLAEARRLEAAARMGLRAVLDLPAGEPLLLAEPPAEPAATRDEGGYVERALERRPELAALRARLQLLEQTDTRLAREAFPRLGVTLGLDAAPASQAFGYGGLSVELPVAQRNQGPRALVAAQRGTEETRLELELRRVHREVASAFRGLAERKAQLRLLVEQALPAAERSVALVEQGWRAGRFDVFRLTAATRELQRVRQQQLETLLLAWLDLIDLERSSGGLNP